MEYSLIIRLITDLNPWSPLSELSNLTLFTSCIKVQKMVDVHNKNETHFLKLLVSLHIKDIF